MNMITKEDEKTIAEKIALTMDQPLSNRAFLLGVAYLCHTVKGIRIETHHDDEFPDEVLGIFDELMEHFTKESAIDHEKAIDPELNRAP